MIEPLAIFMLWVVFTLVGLVLEDVRKYRRHLRDLARKSDASL